MQCQSEIGRAALTECASAKCRSPSAEWKCDGLRKRNAHKEENVRLCCPAKIVEELRGLRCGGRCCCGCCGCCCGCGCSCCGGGAGTTIRTRDTCRDRGRLRLLRWLCGLLRLPGTADGTAPTRCADRRPRVRGIAGIERRRSASLIVFDRLPVSTNESIHAWALRYSLRLILRRRLLHTRARLRDWRRGRCAGHSSGGRADHLWTRENYDALEDRFRLHGLASAPGEISADGAEQYVERLFFGNVVEREGQRRRRHPFGIFDEHAAGAAPGLEDLCCRGVGGDEREPPIAYRELNGIGVQCGGNDRDDRQQGAGEHTNPHVMLY